jgi:4'-phosphopantetheinyl transferase
MQDHWPSGPEQPQLKADAVHVWQARLDVPPERLAEYEALLAEDEQARAARFRFARDKEQYIAGRGMLRVLLGRYLGRSPETLKFSYSDFDKPFLSGYELQFNLAHSGGLVLYAFCREEAVGVDVEVERELADALQISERFFSPAERTVLKSLPQEQRIPAFFRCWSRKEAFIKAVGEGLSYPLDAFDVTLAPDEPARLLSIRGSAGEARQWTLWSLDLPQHYHGALVVRKQDAFVQIWQFVG